MGKITKVSEHIEQACRVYGEEWRDILFKKWSIFNSTKIDNSHVYLVIKVEPSVSKKHLYDTEEQATEAIREIIRERCEKLLKKKNWTRNQPYTHWVGTLENDLPSSTPKSSAGPEGS